VTIKEEEEKKNGTFVCSLLWRKWWWCVQGFEMEKEKLITVFGWNC